VAVVGLTAMKPGIVWTEPTAFVRTRRYHSPQGYSYIPFL